MPMNFFYTVYASIHTYMYKVIKSETLISLTKLYQMPTGSYRKKHYTLYDMYLLCLFSTNNFTKSVCITGHTHTS